MPGKNLNKIKILGFNARVQQQNTSIYENI